jgi:hypothetical protein
MDYSGADIKTHGLSIHTTYAHDIPRYNTHLKNLLFSLLKVVQIHTLSLPKQLSPESAVSIRKKNLGVGKKKRFLKQ